MNRHGVIGVVLGAAAVVAMAALPSVSRAPASPGTISAVSIRVIDGDTVAIGSERIRFTAIDAPEIDHAHCAAELDAGYRAKAEVIRLIGSGAVSIERTGRTDRYGRTLGDVVVSGRTVGAALMELGLALPYRPGREAHRDRTAHWCGPGNW